MFCGFADGGVFRLRTVVLLFLGLGFIVGLYLVMLVMFSWIELHVLRIEVGGCCDWFCSFVMLSYGLYEFCVFVVWGWF